MRLSWHEFYEVMHNLWPLSPIAAGVLCASVLLSIALAVAALVARKNPSSPAVRKLSALVLVTFASGALLSSRVIAEGHRVLVERQLPPGDVKGYSAWSWGMDTSAWAWLLVGLALSTIALFSGLAALLRARHLGQPLATVVLCSALLALATGVGLVYHAHEGRIAVGFFCGGDVHSYIDDTRKDGHLAVALFRRVIVALGGLSALLVLLAARKKWRGPDEPEEREPQDREAGLAIGAGLFALGLALWVGTRGMAHDAAHPLAMPGPNDISCRCSDSVGCSERRKTTLAELPPAVRCEGPSDAVQIDFDANGVFIDGLILRDPDDLALVLKNKRDLFRQLQNKEPPGYINIQAPSSHPTKELVPWLAAARATGFSDMRIVGSHAQEQTATGTLGDLARDARCCVTRLPLATKAPLFTSYATWGEVARDAADGVGFALEPEDYR